MELRKTQSCIALAITAASLCLAGCGEKALDYRNAQINNGKVYAGDSNTPFSGTLTNVSAGQILSAQNGFAKLVNVVNYDLPSATVGAMGLSSICDAHIKDGGLDGKATCKTPQSDVVRMQMVFKAGALDGDFVVFDTAGREPFVTVTFRGGLPEGEQKVYSPKTHKLVYVNHWDGGVATGEEEGYYEETGNRYVHATRVNGQYDGELLVYAPDGKQLIHRVTYVAGKKQGADDQYDAATGKQIGHADWESNQMNGVVKTWDTNGKLLKEVTYDRGIRLATADESAAQATADAQAKAALQANTDKQRRAQAVTACFSQRINAYDAQHGGSAASNRTVEQTRAMEQQCEQSVGPVSTQ
ncbi:toxin-antitoxin system YwqK family antitoxin [Ralstonia solanacearum]|uniref:Toxin-antitoxin system YwqK family antitoxin n=1 Tax=Ralstonia solanacearum TaxID=305 RepID=A0AAE3NMJ6_RALSL|nr:toxin-antitoxin system YwqK family antitoxin [Ralstonia solanacearum]MBB6580931.1 toxin-antitoxin system YwqK family antitoxin [Ralstonia solanacearum]MDB0524298.1 toxin-antitoxin system YwqK family antitoxin [Ralstonia solanacearum]